MIISKRIRVWILSYRMLSITLIISLFLFQRLSWNEETLKENLIEEKMEIEEVMEEKWEKDIKIDIFETAENEQLILAEAKVAMLIEETLKSGPVPMGESFIEEEIIGARENEQKSKVQIKVLANSAASRNDYSYLKKSKILDEKKINQYESADLSSNEKSIAAIISNNSKIKDLKSYNGTNVKEKVQKNSRIISSNNYSQSGKIPDLIVIPDARTRISTMQNYGLKLVAIGNVNGGKNSIIAIFDGLKPRYKKYISKSEFAEFKRNYASRGRAVGTWFSDIDIYKSAMDLKENKYVFALAVPKEIEAEWIAEEMNYLLENNIEVSDNIQIQARYIFGSDKILIKIENVVFQ